MTEEKNYGIHYPTNLTYKVLVKFSHSSSSWWLQNKGILLPINKMEISNLLPFLSVKVSVVQK